MNYNKQISIINRTRFDSLRNRQDYIAPEQIKTGRATVIVASHSGDDSYCTIQLNGTDIPYEGAICYDSYLNAGDVVEYKINELGVVELIASGGGNAITQTITNINNNNNINGLVNPFGVVLP